MSDPVTSTAVLPIGESTVAFAFGLGWPGLLMLAVVKGSPNAPAAATSIVNTGSFIGSIAGPAAFGLLVTHTGYGVGWVLTALCLVTAAARP